MYKLPSEKLTKTFTHWSEENRISNTYKIILECMKDLNNENAYRVPRWHLSQMNLWIQSNANQNLKACFDNLKTFLVLEEGILWRKRETLPSNI